MPKKPKINCDVDGVLADFTQATLLHLLRAHGVKLRPSDITKWEITNHPQIVPYADSVLNAWNDRHFCHTMPIYAGAQIAIRRMREFADIHFVTAPLSTSPYWERERARWLRSHFDADFGHIHFTKDKSDYEGRLFIDDKPEHVLAWREKQTQGLGIVWKRAYNRGHSSRTNNWDLAVHIGERLCRAKKKNLPQTKAKLLNLLEDSVKVGAFKLGL